PLPSRALRPRARRGAATLRLRAVWRRGAPLSRDELRAARDEGGAERAPEPLAAHAGAGPARSTLGGGHAVAAQGDLHARAGRVALGLERAERRGRLPLAPMERPQMPAAPGSAIVQALQALLTKPGSWL